MPSATVSSMAAPIRKIGVAAYEIPTDAPESDGTLEWSATTLVTVHITAGNETGFGYTYAHASVAGLIRSLFADLLVGFDAFAIPEAHREMVKAIRNLGGSGLTSHAIAAVDIALWDLKARLLQLPLHRLLGTARESVPIYGSGGFTSYDDTRLADQFGGWAAEGFTMMKMKVGREPERDPSRMNVARRAIGGANKLFIDANGAFQAFEAVAFAERAAAFDVRWFEEPTSSDDLDGLRRVRDRAPGNMAIAAGEYGYRPEYFARMLAARSVDILQADASRCRGITGFLEVAALCDAVGMPLSAHTAPSLHLAVCCAAPTVVHLEWFHDHVRIEEMLFEGAARPEVGRLKPSDAPGMGVELRISDAEQFAV
ncbi:MAG: enolase C-terminal domain-like protein [Dehalococcoidia bacterium]